MWRKVFPTFLLLSFLYYPQSFSHYISLQAKDLEANAESYIELLAKGTGKPKEEIAKDIQRPKYMQAKEAIAYGLADKIIDSQDAAYEKRVMFSLIKTNKFFADI